MSTAQTLTAFQEVSAVAVVGSCPITSELITSFQQKGIAYVEDPSLADYCIVWGDAPAPSDTAAKLIFLNPYYAWSKQTTRFAHSRHIFLGSLYGEAIIEPTLKQMVEEVLGGNSLVLPGDGMGKLYLLAVNKAVEGIVSATINPRSHSEIYLLGQEYSLLTLAYHLRSSQHKAININFDHSRSWQEPLFDREQAASGLLSLGIPNITSEDHIAPYFSYLLTSHKTEPSQPPREAKRTEVVRLTRYQPPKTHRVIPQRIPKATPIQFEPIIKPRNISAGVKLPPIKLHLPRNLSRVLIVLGIAVCIHVASILVSGIGLVYSLQSASNSLTSGREHSYAMGSFFATYLEANLSALGVIPALSNFSNDATALTSSIQQIFDLAPDIAELYVAGEGIATHLLGSTDQADIVSQINTSRLLVEGTFGKLSQLEASLPPTPPTFLPSKYQNKYVELTSSLKAAKQHVLTSKAILAVLPDIIGIGERRKYALLLQNNMELRPTGGFIGSFALLSFDNGRLYDLPVYDVYQADGQLKGHVEPPFAIKKYLGEANWYLRDSNWDPNFTTTSDRVAWYIKKTLNQDVDGVIGINLSVIKTIIGAIGGLSVPEYDEVITADNIYERTQYHAEIGFFPGSTQKKEFLGAMVAALMARLNTADTTLRLQVGEALLSSLSSQEATVAVNNPATQAVFKRLGWSGEIKNTGCLVSPCISSYLAVIDANVGVNKANFYTSRDITLTIDLDKSLNATHTLQIKQMNSATSSAWPAGPYKNYQRLYLPQGVELISLVRDGIAIPSRDIDTTVEYNKTVLGYLVTTPTSGTSELIATYRLPQQVADVPSSLDFYWQKQPGTSGDPLTVIINYPLFLKPSTISPPATNQPQQLIFDLANSSDRRVHVEFGRE